MLANALRGNTIYPYLPLLMLSQCYAKKMTDGILFPSIHYPIFTGDGDMLDGIVSTPEELAEIIEDKIFEKNKQTNPKYKAQVRSRVFNLKDKKNPALRENVLCGVIKPEKIAVMTSEEMASDEVK